MNSDDEDDEDEGDEDDGNHHTRLDSSSISSACSETGETPQEAHISISYTPKLALCHVSERWVSYRGCSVF